ncbi:MAG: FKBP-type peptidyl-prolyl cis-trans isomerase [Marinoscillum sp.]
MRKKSALGKLLVVMIALSGLTSCNDDPFDPIQQFEHEQKQIDDYLADNGLSAKEDTLGYGLRYVTLQEGSGPKPKLDQVVLVDYEGTVLTNGNVFDSGDSVYANLSRVILGWQVLMPHLREGGEMLMFMPSVYAYGQSGVGEIPGGVPLIYKVKLRDVTSQFAYEQARIGQYLEEHELVAETDSIEGLRYIITEEGDEDGDWPTATSTVNVDYEGRYLVNDEVFDSNSGVDFNLGNLIDGWGILMPYVKEGGSITMFIPSKFAYGTTGSSSGIPPYATLIFEVKLNSVK